MADLLELETCTVDLEQGVVLRDARTLKLTTLETRLVRYLCDRLGQDVSRDELLTEVWEYAPTTSSRAVDNTLFRLRRKIEADPKDPVHLQTVYGGGYRLFLRSTEPTPVRPPLPAELDELVGREHELERLKTLLSEGARLVTFTGPGGSGKTRLAVHAAHILGSTLEGGARFASLVDCSACDELCFAVARALGMQLEKGGVAELGTMLAGQGNSLLVLDDMGELAQPAIEAIERWLALAPELCVLGTCRTPLAIAGEHVVAIGGLPLEDAKRLWSLRLGDSTADEAPEIEALVRAVDGLPLAIELAAARMSVLDLQGLLARLDDPLRLLRATSDPQSRHGSMEAVLEWTWSRLDEQEQEACRQLAVFRAGFSLQAAHAVLQLGADAPDTLDLVARLQSRNLLRSVPSTGRRFALYQLVRARASREGPHLEAARRHRSWFSEMGADLRWTRLAADALGLEERENLQAALEQAIAEGDAPQAARLGLAVWAVLDHQGPVSLGHQALRRAARLPQEDPSLRLQLSLATGRALCRLGDLEAAEQQLSRTLEEARAEGLPRLVGQALDNLGTTHLHRGHYEQAEQTFSEAARVSEDAGEELNAGVSRANLATVYLYTGRNEEGAVLLRAALERFEELGARFDAAVYLGNEGILLARKGCLEEARLAWEEAITWHEHFGRGRSIAITAQNLGRVCLMLGDPDSARTHLDKAMDTAKAMGLQEMIAQAWELRSLLALDSGKPAEAAQAARKGIAHGQRWGYARAEALARLALGWALVEGGNREGAQEAFAGAQEAFGDLGDEDHVISARVGLALSDEAEPATLHALREEISGMGDRVERDRLLALLAKGGLGPSGH